MIQLVPSLTLDGRFTAQDLPDALQLLLLNHLVVPRIVSSSMMPTIQQGDRLELSPPTSLTVGTIIVFRHDTMLVCHRITAIDPQGMLSTRGDAAQGVCEAVQPNSVIGVVTGVLRKGMYLSLGQDPRTSFPLAQQTSFKNNVWPGIVRSATVGLRMFAGTSFFRHMLAILLRWTATVDVLAPAPLRCLSFHCKTDSFSIRTSPPNRSFSPSSGPPSAQYVVRMGPWQLAQYDPATEYLLLRQCLREAGLEPFFRQICSKRQTISD